MKNEIVQRILLALVIIPYGVVTYWLFWPYTPIHIKEPMKIENKTVRAGDTLVYVIDRRRDTAIPGTIVRQLVNDITITYAPILSNTIEGEAKIRIPLIVPTFAPLGKYKVKWDGTYKVNPIREVTITAWSEEFEVVK